MGTGLLPGSCGSEEGRRTVTFIDLVLAGKASLDDIDDWVRRWHCGETLLELRDWLGMTEHQYRWWNADHRSLRTIVETVRQGYRERDFAPMAVVRT